MKSIFCVSLFVLLTNAVKDPLVLLISFDGFRYNYLERTATPNFDRLIREGVKAKWIKDFFVSQTFPNHYGIATGLFEESHGIVGNRFYDPSLNRSFNYGNVADVVDPVFWGGEPIWVTNQLQGRKSGVYFWVGSEAPIKNIRPTVWKNFNTSVPWRERVDTVVSWLANKESLDITLALLYFSQPDHFGHTFGPESPEVTDMIGQCDNITGYLIRQLELSGIFDDVNIIITSDHGMATLNQTRTAAIKPHLNMTEIDQYINYGTGAAIWPKAGYIDSTYQSLLGIGSHVSVWKKDNIPLEFHYRSNVRIPPILLMPQDKWFLVNNSKDPINLRGSHGYNNSLMDMHPFFIARGPAFRSGFVSEPFRSVDIYGLICEIMGLDPAPNNGSLSEVQQLLAPSDYFLATVIGVIVGSVLASFVLVSILIYFNKGIIRKRPKTDSFSSGSRPLLESNIS